MPIPPRAAAVLLSLLQSRQEVVIRTHLYTPPSMILQAETNLVETPLTVRDYRGRTIAGLHAADFEIFDNGIAQKITAFSELHANGKSIAPPASTSPSQAEKITPAAAPPAEPKFVTFFFDDFHLTTSPGMMFISRAAHNFVGKGLKPSTKVSIVTASGHGDLDFTNDVKAFNEKLTHLQAGPRACGDIGTPDACGAEGTLQPNGTITSSELTAAQSLTTISALEFAAKRLSEMNGTRILMINSYGFNMDQNQMEMQRLIDAAVRWNIVVHGIDARGLPPLGLRAQAIFWRPLEKITDATGGHFFTKTNDFSGAMELATNPETTYLLAFNPGSRDGKFHDLKIKLKSHRDDDVQFRHGYFSPADQTKLLSARSPLDNAVFSKQTLREIPAAVRVSPANASVSVNITLDVKGLQFAIDKGRHAQQIVFLMTLLDANGAFVTGKESIMELELTDEKLASLRKDGLKAVVTLNAPAGAYQVRTIVREAMKGNLAASTIPVELRAK